MKTRLENIKKPTAKEYLDASLEEIVARADKSPLESEIPFTTVLLAAKANQAQESTSKKMLWVSLIATFLSLVSLIVAAISLINSDQINTKENSRMKIEMALLKSELSNLKLNVFKTEKQLQSAFYEISILENKHELYSRMTKPINEAEIKIDSNMDK